LRGVFSDESRKSDKSKLSKSSMRLFYLCVFFFDHRTKKELNANAINDLKITTLPLFGNLYYQLGICFHHSISEYIFNEFLF